MSMLGNVQDKMGDMSDEMRERMQMLTSKEQAGTLDDKGRAELQQLRSRYENHGGQ